MNRALSLETRLAFITKPHEEAGIKECFEETSRQIKAQHGDALMDVDLLLLRDFSKERDEFDILFDLAEEAILDPESEARYVIHGIETEARRVQSADITAQLKKVEAGLDLPAFNLRRGGPKLTKRDAVDEIAGATARQVVVAPWRSRVKAELIDLTYQIVLAVFLTIGLFWFLEPDLREELLAPTTMHLSQALCVGALFVSLLLLNFLLYPFFAGTKSTGQKILGLEILTEGGRTPKGHRLLLRSLLTPVSALLSPLWIRRSPLRDRMSRLVVAVSEP